MNTNDALIITDPPSYGFMNIGSAINYALDLFFFFLLILCAILLIVSIAKNYNKKGFFKALLIASFINGLTSIIIFVLSVILSVVLATLFSGFIFIFVLVFFIAPGIIAHKINKKLGYVFSWFDATSAYLGFSILLCIFYQIVYYYTFGLLYF